MKIPTESSRKNSAYSIYKYGALNKRVIPKNDENLFN